MNVRGLFRKITNKITKSKEKEIEVEREEVLSDRSSKTKNISEKIYCRFCGKPNSQAQEICTKCGIRLNPPPSTIMKACTKCGLAANDDSIFCTRCGTRFEDA
jgi:RNA polymerase subunit RPABC4/transcription elongation factor Spt4